MRKVLTVALALILVVSVTGVLAFGAGETDNPRAAMVYDDPSDVPKELDDEITSKDLEGVEKLVVVEPKAFEDAEDDEKAWLQRAKENDEVMVWVDPISVGG